MAMQFLRDVAVMEPEHQGLLGTAVDVVGSGASAASELTSGMASTALGGAGGVLGPVSSALGAASELRQGNILSGLSNAASAIAPIASLGSEALGSVLAPASAAVPAITHTLAAAQATDRMGNYQNNQFWTNSGGAVVNGAKALGGPLVSAGVSAAAGATDLVGQGLGRVLGTQDASGQAAPAFTANSVVGTGMHLAHDAVQGTISAGRAAAPYVKSAASSAWNGLSSMGSYAMGGLSSAAESLFGGMYGG